MRRTTARLAVCATAVAAMLGPAVTTTSAQEVFPIGMDDSRGVMLSTTEPLFVGGQYMWGVEFWVPTDPYGEAVDPPAPVPVTVVWDWGDGTTATASSADGGVGCTTEPDGPARCSSWMEHDYAAQGLYRIVVTASQPGALDGVLEAGQAVYDLALGGSVRGVGTLTARSGGMYDQDFTEGEASFSISAKRRSGSGATSVALVISVPSMVADYTGGLGMTFTGLAATQPLMVQRLGKADAEVFLDRVYGTVTNSAGPAGTAQAMLHAVIRKGQPTLVRFSVWNTSAGYTYADSSTTVFPTRWALVAGQDVLTSGVLKVG